MNIELRPKTYAHAAVVEIVVDNNELGVIQVTDDESNRFYVERSGRKPGKAFSALDEAVAEVLVRKAGALKPLETEMVALHTLATVNSPRSTQVAPSVNLC